MDMILKAVDVWNWDYAKKTARFYPGSRCLAGATVLDPIKSAAL